MKGNITPEGMEKGQDCEQGCEGHSGIKYQVYDFSYSNMPVKPMLLNEMHYNIR